MNLKKRLMGIFTRSLNVRYRVDEIFNILGETCQTIHMYEVVDPNRKDKTMLLTFFCDNYDLLKDHKEYKLKPVTLHRKENNVLMTLNGMNLFMGSKNPEDNKDKKIDVSEIGENKLVTKGEGDIFKISDLILVKKFYNRKKGEDNATYIK